VNDAPVNTVPGAQITSTNTPVAFSSANANAISISDADAGAGTVQVTLTGINGTSTLSSTTGLTFSIGDGTGDATMAFTGSIANINAALNGLSFTPTIGFSGAASLQVATDDQGNAGSGGAQTDTDTIAITVNAGAPIAADNAYTVDEDGTLTVGWWDTDWTRRSQITFAGNTFGGAENLTDFPVLVTLTSANIDYAQTQNQGQDLRFLDADGTPLAYEIESWNESGTSYVWVSVPQVDTTGADSIWMYYGNAAAPAGQDAAAVWTGGYEAVYHLSESGATIADAAGAIDGTAVNGAAAATGFIAGGRDLDGVDDHINLGSDVPLLTSVSGATLSAWVNLDVIAAGIDQGLISISVNTTPPTGISRAALELSGEEIKLIGRSLDSGADAHSLLTTGSAMAGLQGAWHQLTGVVDYANDSFAIYLDGVLIQSASAPGVNFTNTTTDGTPSTNAAIGSGDEGIGLFADGRLDEMRIAGVARSAAWVRAEYLSMSGGLVSVGAAQNAPATQGVLGNDGDPQDDALTATLVSGPANAASFTLNADGTFTYVPVANFAGSDTFTYTAWDGANTSNTATVTITVNPVNDEPSFVLAGNQTVNEDAGAQTVVGFATPAPGGGADEAGQTFTYSVSNSNNVLFSVQPTIDASGTLTFTAAAGAFGTATVTVSVTDSGGTASGGDDTSASQVFTITVNPVADTPSVTNATTNEDTQTASGLVISRNASDSNEVTHFKVTGIAGGTLYLNDGTTAVVDGSFITFAQANAGLRFTPAADSTANGSFQVQASTSNVDAGLGGGLATATITVNAVNDAPVVASLGGDALAYQEGDGALVIEQGGNAAVTDIDSADFDTGVLTMTITAGGQPAEDVLSVRNQGVGAGQIGFVAGSVTYQGVTIGTAAGGSAGTPLSITLNISATPAAVGALLRNITYENTDTLNATAGARTVSFVVTDGDGGASLAQSATVTVTAVNAPPVAADDAAATDEDSALVVAAPGVLGNDSDPESGALTVTEVNGSAVSVGSPIVLASGAVLTLNANGSFTYDPNGAFEGLDAGDSTTDSFTYQVSDPGGANDTATVTINLSGVADAPASTGIANVTVDEDAPATVIDLFAAFADAEDADASLTYTVQANSNPALFGAVTVNGAAGTLTLDYTPDANGSAVLMVRATDTSGAFVESTFTVTINAVNDAPALALGLNQSIAEDAGAQSAAGFAVAAPGGGGDESAQTFAYSVTNNNNALFSLQPTIDAAGNLTYTAAADAFGTATVSVTLTDSGGTANGGVDTAALQTFTITVTPVNDVPTTAGIADITVDEDAPASVIDLFATFADLEDADAALTYTVQSNSNPALFSSVVVNGGAGTLTLGHAADVNGTATLVVRATDTGGDFVESTFNVTVDAVNDAPVLTLGGNQTVAEDAGAQSVGGFGSAAAGGGADEVTQTFTYTVTNSNNALFSVQPTMDPAGNLAYTAAPDASGTATVTVVLSDSGGTANGGSDTSAAQTFTITVTPVNDVPTTAGIGNVTVDEDAANTIVDLFAAFADVEDADTALTYTVQSNSNPALFSSITVNGGLGTLTLGYPADMNGSSTLVMRATDTSGDFSDATFTVTVNAVNDAPVLTIGANQTVVEDAGLQAMAGFATAAAGGGADEAVQTLSYTLSNSNSALFSVQPTIDAAGILTFTAAPDASGSATVTVSLADSGGTANGGVDASPVQTFTITVTPVNDAPALTANALTITQGGRVTLTASNVAATDADDAAAGLLFTVSNVVNGQFELASAPTVAVTSFTQAQVAAGQVVFVHSGSAAPAYRVQVSDGALTDGPAAANVSFSAIVIVDEPDSPPPPPPELPAEVEPPPAATAPAPPEEPLPEAPPVFSPGRPDSMDNVVAETITQLKRAEARHLTKVVQPVLSLNDYEPPPPVDVVMELLNVSPAQLEYQGSTPADWVIANAFTEGFQDEAQQQLEILLDSVRFGGMALSVGMVWWASRISAMLGSLLASAPAWRNIDPLPVLGGDDEEEKDKWLEPEDRDADANELAVALVLEGGRTPN
jgi:VCBS repeat-containing protein